MEPFGTIIVATELGSMLGGAIADLVEKSVKKIQLQEGRTLTRQALRLPRLHTAHPWGESVPPRRRVRASG